MSASIGIDPKDKVVNTSLYSLRSTAFDNVNYRTTPANTTLAVDTPRGVLGGMVASIFANRVADICTHLKRPLGLFSQLSEGLAYQNPAGLASGLVPIYMVGGNFFVYYFETHTADNVAFDFAVDYAVSTLLYCSPYGFLTPELPTEVEGAEYTGIDEPIAMVTASPSATNKELLIKLLI
jgi:hypothetical protein